MTGIKKESHMQLLKVYRLTKAIEALTKDAESPYVVPAKELAQARSYLRSDIKLCLKHLQRAHTLYQQESALAVRYQTVADYVRTQATQDFASMGVEYERAVRSGDYRGAGKILDKMLSSEIPQKQKEHLLVILSDDRRSITIRNKDTTFLRISSITAVDESSSINGGGFSGSIMPGESVKIPLDGAAVGTVLVNINYSSGGRSFKRDYRVGESHESKNTR